jgi:hypothetical protein
MGNMRPLYLPRPGRRARLIGVGCGLALLFWLSLEDNHAWGVAALGWMLAALLLALALLNRLGGQTLPAASILPGAVLLGLATGLAASIATAALMFFKNAMHAHIFLDYPPGMMLALLARAPGWALAGGLAGAGLALAWGALRRETHGTIHDQHG